MEIVFVCTRSITFNTFLKSQAEYLLKKGFKVKVVCADNENLDFKKSLSYKIYFPTKYIHLFNITNYYKIFFQIRKLVKNNKSSVFYLHTPIASYLFRMFSISYNIKLVYFVHGFRFTSKTNFIKSFFFKTIENILSFKTNVIITINEEDLSYAKKKFVNKSQIYKLNGVGLDKLKNNSKIFKLKKNIKKILVIGAYKKSKGYYEVLKIAEFLKEYSIKVECFGYGDIKKFQNIKTKKNLNNLILNKFDMNLKKKIKSYDLLLHLSNREGLPVSVMECLSEGLPVICKEIRGNNDLIVNKFNGFFVKSYKEAVYKILYLNMENTTFNKMRNNAFNSITEKFSKKNINNEIYKILRKI